VMGATGRIVFGAEKRVRTARPIGLTGDSRMAWRVL
jgi:hypothetical protein